MTDAQKLKHLLRAAEVALIAMRMTKDSISESGITGDNREVCAEAKYLTVPIRKLAKAINKAKGQ